MNRADSFFWGVGYLLVWVYTLAVWLNVPKWICCIGRLRRIEE